MTKYPDDDFFTYTDSSVIVCGECVKKDLADTRAGNLVGEERVTENMINPAPSDDGPYQCDGCNKQSDDYDDDEYYDD